MKSGTVDTILALNKDFYEHTAIDFSRTRQSPWKGWFNLLPIIQKQFAGKDSIAVFDIACGNGRFAKFLKENLAEFDIDYLGLDANKTLLEEAIHQNSSEYVTYKLHDVIQNLDSVEGQYDLVVAFGITHHIPSKKLRIKWFQSLSKLVSDSGILCFTIWDYAEDERFGRSFKEIPDIINKSELEKGDHFLGWDKMPGVYRYYHIYDDIELSLVHDKLSNLGLDTVQSFSSDGKDGNLNKYLIYKAKMCV